MSYKPYKLGTALWYAFLLWIFGFVWGTIVFMVPGLKNLPTMPHISKYPAISFPILIGYLMSMFFLARSYLREADQKSREGLKLGLALFLVNVALDALVYVGLFQSEDYFAFFSIWFAYAMLILVPWLIGNRWPAEAAT